MRELKYSIGLAALFVAAVFIYKDEFTFFGFNSILIATACIVILFYFYKSCKIKSRKMNNNLSIILQQAQWINSHLSATHPAKQCAEETIENLESVIGGGGIKNPPPN